MSHDLHGSGWQRDGVSRDADPSDCEVEGIGSGRRVRRQMGHVREAFRLRRLASMHSRVRDFYEEHNLFAEASVARREVLQLLRGACCAWRRALGLAPRRDEDAARGSGSQGAMGSGPTT
jgi:hypothetical protein